MSEINDGGPAFPQAPHKFLYNSPDEARIYAIPTGMSLRDWFAGMALQGMLASHSVKDSGEDDVLNFSVISELAYRYAHSMLKERAE